MKIINLVKTNFPLIILSLIPLSFVIGPFLTELFINFLIIFFLIEIFKNKEFSFLKNNIFIYFFIFYLFLIFSHLNSEYIHQNSLNVFSYIRFIILPFAIFFILDKNQYNLKTCYLILSITIFIVVADGIYQFFFDKNIIGFQKYRLDRISGFFKDDLVLGSYVMRLLPLLIGLTLFFKDEFKLNFLNVILIFLSLILIFFSGERASFFMIMIALTLIFFYINLSLYVKSFFILLIFFVISFVLFFNPIVFDRYFNQLKAHIMPNDDKQNILPYYKPMFETSLKMYKFNKLIGTGPKSYRYVCDNENYITYFPGSTEKIDNTKIIVPTSWKELRNLKPIEFFVKKGDNIIIGDKIFSYTFVGDEKVHIYFSDKEGIVNKVFKKERYITSDTVLEVDPQETERIIYKKRNSCNTHPHNFYFQLLGETGLIGFLFMIFLFFYLSIIIIKSLSYKFFKNKKILSDPEFCIFVGFFICLWPLTTNGNFFNNWINLISFYPLGFYLFLRNERING